MHIKTLVNLYRDTNASITDMMVIINWHTVPLGAAYDRDPQMQGLSLGVNE